MNLPEQLLLKPIEAAKLLNISARKLWQLTHDGKIACVRIGRNVRYDVQYVVKWIEEHRRMGVT